MAPKPFPDRLSAQTVNVGCLCRVGLFVRRLSSEIIEMKFSVVWGKVVLVWRGGRLLEGFSGQELDLVI